jgi:hypothetical protein
MQRILVTVEHEDRSFVAAAVARIENMYSTCPPEYIERDHTFLTATSPRGDMAALEKPEKMVERDGNMCEHAEGQR